jgi:RNA polymerase-binding transcription factor DksA
MKVLPKVKNPPLSAKQVKALHELLVKERSRALSYLAGVDELALNQGNNHGERERDRSSYSIHQADFASDTQSLDIALSTRSIEEARLEEIEWALRNIGNERFGKCQRCTANIGFERMQAHPYAQYCIICRRELEAA